MGRLAKLFRALGFGGRTPPPEPMTKDDMLTDEERETISKTVQRSMRRSFMARVRIRN